MPASSESLTKALGAMSEFFVGEATLRETLQQVAELACQTVPGAAMVGITMLGEDMEVVPAVVELEVAVPRLRPAVW